MDFIIDTVGKTSNTPVQKDGNNVIAELLKDYRDSSSSQTCSKAELSAKENIHVHEILEDLGWNNKSQFKKTYTTFNRRNVKEDIPESHDKSDIRDVLKKSLVLSQNFEDLHSIPPFEISEKKITKGETVLTDIIDLQKEREKTKGKKWYGLPATEMTEEVKHDLEILQMRSVLDPKHFYKKNDLSVLPKYFQFGTVMDTPVDYYKDRIPKNKRKKTLVDELLADANFNKYNKRKYKEIIEDRQKTHYKAWRTAKKIKEKEIDYQVFFYWEKK
ncbi:hypothetical protein NQ318_017362 [Aromia moschata]|uniref:Fcf2 pre-rRNA processing C-terminal domain-containing protein n=1 Tax=Aromia moschata TaxID=1265417 RepID=A0AAV8Z253_9CUCU|nr:hypothetical protein NQ318_017362 [Aromia moschata]